MKSLYIVPTEPRSGKSVVALGMMELLLRNYKRVCCFRPIVKSASDDNDFNLINTYFKLEQARQDSYAYTLEEAWDLINLGQHDALLEGIFNKFKRIESEYDFVLCLGTDFEDLIQSFEVDLNADIAKFIGVSLMIVSNGKNKNLHEATNSALMSLESLQEKDTDVFALIVNQFAGDDPRALVYEIKKKVADQTLLVYCLPDAPELGLPTISDVVECLDAQLLYGQSKIDRHVKNYIIAAMQLPGVLKYMDEGTLIITPSDRPDVLIGGLLTSVSNSYPHIAGILLTGSEPLDERVATLIEGWSNTPAPVLWKKDSTSKVAEEFQQIYVRIRPDDRRKISSAFKLFDDSIDIPEVREGLRAEVQETVTPKMFEYRLIQNAKNHKQHIVLPEGEDERILKATDILVRRDVVKITLLGVREQIQKCATRLGISLNNVSIIEPSQSERFEEYAETYAKLRQHKGIGIDQARDIMQDVNYFGSMMVYLGHADGMVSGAIHTTQHTIRPAFEIIKTQEQCSLVSSVFFMCLQDKVLVYGDCAINPDPDSQALAEIAIQSAETASTFGIVPRVAMLSYSTGTSGQGEEVEKVRQATQIAKDKRPDLAIEGPIQYDAAIDPDVAKLKMPNSPVAGQATVFIFPDLNTGNNTYKAVQRSAHAVAVGPVLQGLRKPVNDLSRGCEVPDIVNTVAITALQAQ